MPVCSPQRMSGSDNAIVDHTTTAWGTDETVSGRGAKNITFQYSTIFEALGIADHKNYPSGTNHGYAATIDGKVGSRSGIKGQIDHEDDCGGFEAYPEETRAADFDSDQDGMPDWYEKLIGSDANTANNNDDPDKDGWTLLEGYLEFMANPYLIIKPGESGTIDMAQFFKGFTKSPQYSVATDSGLFSATVSGSAVTVKANQAGGIGTATMKVTDSEGSTHEKRLSIAVTGEPTGITTPWSDETVEVAKRKFYTVDGKRAKSFRSGEVYIMKVTDTKGNTHSTKVIKN